MLSLLDSRSSDLMIYIFTGIVNRLFDELEGPLFGNEYPSCRIDGQHQC